ncbi:hypothetical protein FRC12_020868 [Ceratobasidium sp. 428]|nr:hypothetical protein FRC12_020868 [Ceratobasidium sp. 428]
MNEEFVGLNGGGMEVASPMAATMALHLLAFKYVMLASFVILIYDHVVTFSDEVDRIWRRKWTGATWLFALNRYATELFFIVDIVCRYISTEATL